MDNPTLGGQELRDKIFPDSKSMKVKPLSSGLVCLWARRSCLSLG